MPWQAAIWKIASTVHKIRGTITMLHTIAQIKWFQVIFCGILETETDLNEQPE